MAHFHYTIMGGLVFTFFAAIYYWVPKMFGTTLNERLGKIHFWMMFIAFNSTFFPLFALGLMGMPRRVVTYPSHLQALNDWVSVSAFVLGPRCSCSSSTSSTHWRSSASPRRPTRGTPSPRVATQTPVPVHNFDRRR